MEQEFAEKLRTSETPIAAVLEDQHVTRAPKARLPRDSFIQTSIDHSQVDHEFKHEREAQTAQYRHDLQHQMDADRQRRVEEHERIYNPEVPLSPLPPSDGVRLLLHSRRLSGNEGVKIMNEERIAQHVNSITRETTPLGDRLGKEKPQPVHSRPLTDADSRKQQLQKERVALLDELRREREALQTRLKQEELALNQMEKEHYPFHQEPKSPVQIRFTKTSEVRLPYNEFL